MNAESEARSCRPHDSSDSLDETVPPRRFDHQLPSAGRGQPIVFGALLVVRHLPLCGDPRLSLQAMERRIQRSPLDAEFVVGARTDGQPDSMAVLGTPLQRAEDHHVERPLQKPDGFAAPIDGRHVEDNLAHTY